MDFVLGVIVGVISLLGALLLSFYFDMKKIETDDREHFFGGDHHE